MGEDAQKLTLTIDGGPGSDPQELAQLTTQLRGRLLELDVESVEMVRGTEVPYGAKPADLIALGTLAIQLAPNVLPSVVSFLTGWVKSRPLRDLELTMKGDTIKLTGVSAEEQQMALQAFISKHAKS